MATSTLKSEIIDVSSAVTVDMTVVDTGTVSAYYKPKTGELCIVLNNIILKNAGSAYSIAKIGNIASPYRPSIEANIPITAYTGGHLQTASLQVSTNGDLYLINGANDTTKFYARLNTSIKL